MKRHLALVGFMAAGKSTIGQKLARTLKCSFHDVDDEIVKEHGPIADIFYNKGEAAFRRFEYDAVARVLESPDPGVVAVGGGAVTHEPTLDLLKKRSYRVFIKVTPEQIAKRLHHNGPVRPLLGPTPPLHRIKELYAARMPKYAHSDFVVEADGLTTAQIVEQIVEWTHKKKIAL